MYLCFDVAVILCISCSFVYSLSYCYSVTLVLWCCRSFDFRSIVSTFKWRL